VEFFYSQNYTYFLHHRQSSTTFAA